MSIGAALNKSISGLQATQVGLSVISTNVASANIPGYVRREVRVTDGGGDGQAAAGVQSTWVARALDTASQTLLRRASTQNGEAETRKDALQQLDALMGGPNSAQGLDALYRQFSAALVAASNDRGNDGAMTSLVAAGKSLAGELDRLSRAIQSMRTDAEGNIGATVREVNSLAAQLADVNTQLGTAQEQNDLLDRRDRLVDQLAALGDFNFSQGERGRINVTTRGGLSIVGIGGATQLEFDQRGALGPQDIYSSDPSARRVGTIKINGLDVLGGQHFTSGRLGALIALRDTELAGSQQTLDDLAAGLALSCRDPAAPDGQSLFMDGVSPFTATSRDDPQRVGLAQRLSINSIYSGSPYRLEEMAGAGTDDVFTLIASRLSSFMFETRKTIGSAQPGSQNFVSYSSQFVTDHANLIAKSADDADATAVAKANFTKMFAARNGVDVNGQLADMVSLQNAYAANANVIKTIKEMLDVLNSI